MASWGMAAYTGRKMWEDARKTQEENERLLAGRQLFDLGIEEAEKDAELQSQAKKESRRVQSLINSKKTALQAGGVRGAKAYAEVMSGITGDGSTWQAKDGIVYELDKDGNVVNATDMRNVSGAAMLSMAQQFVPDAATVTRDYQVAEAANQQAIRELQIKKMELDNQIRVALTNGASQAQVAQLRGEYALVEQQLRNQSALDVKKLDVSSARDLANLQFQESMAKTWEPKKIEDSVLNQVVGMTIPGGIPQYDSTGHWTSVTVLNPSTKEPVEVELTPEQRSGILSQRDQILLEGAQMAAATGFSGPAMFYTGSAASGITQRRDAEVAAATALAQQALQSYASTPAPGAGLSQVQTPAYGIPSVTSIQPVPVVSGVINPATGLPVMPQVIQGVRQGIAQQNADNYRPGPSVIDPLNTASFGLSGIY